MDEAFGPAATVIYLGEVDKLRAMLAADPALATRESLVGHPTLLQLVACEEPKIVDPLSAAELLVAAGAVTHLPLVSAAGCGNRGVLEFFLDRGIDVDGEDPLWSPLDEALYWSKPETIELLLSRGASVRALSTAAALGDIEAMNGFIVDGALTNSAGPIGSPFADMIPAELANDRQSIIDHAFISAVHGGHRDAATRLLDEGANVNAKPLGLHWRGTALHAAVWRDEREQVEWLLGLGADPTLRDGMVDSTPLGWAEHNGHLELVELLKTYPH